MNGPLTLEDQAQPPPPTAHTHPPLCQDPSAKDFALHFSSTPSPPAEK